jgi:hypothetical protein
MAVPGTRVRVRWPRTACQVDVLFSMSLRKVTCTATTVIARSQPSAPPGYRVGPVVHPHVVERNGRASSCPDPSNSSSSSTDRRTWETVDGYHFRPQRRGNVSAVQRVGDGSK